MNPYILVYWPVANLAQKQIYSIAEQFTDVSTIGKSVNHTRISFAHKNSSVRFQIH